MKRIEATAEPMTIGSAVFDEKGRKYTRVSRYNGAVTDCFWQTVDKAMEFNWAGLVVCTNRLTTDPATYQGNPAPTLLELEHG